jgi:hypothetical protein
MSYTIHLTTSQDHFSSHFYFSNITSLHLIFIALYILLPLTPHNKTHSQLLISFHPNEMSNPTAPPPVPISPPTPLECLRYRYHHGCNLGSVYVVEKWITSSAFPANASDSQSSELAAVTLSVNQIGIDATRTKFEARWTGSVTDADWDWLCNKAQCETPISLFVMMKRTQWTSRSTQRLESVLLQLESAG